MNYTFNELFDEAKIEELLMEFYNLTGIPSAIIDLEGNIVVMAGWKSICTHYHWQFPASARLCDQSEQAIIESVRLGAKTQVIQTCVHGIKIAGAPIRVNGSQIAVLMFGQFFVEPPDIPSFLNRARKFGFPEEDYLKALTEIPTYSLQKVDTMLKYFQKITEMFGEMAFNRLELREERSKELNRERQRLQSIFDRITNVGIQVYNLEGRVLYWNTASEDFFGWSKLDATGKTLDQLMLDSGTYQEFLKNLDSLRQGIQEKPREWVYRDKQGNERVVFSTIVPIFEAGRQEFICLDIETTEHRKFEKELARLDQLHLVGEMAASISHEVRNPMTTVRGFLQVLSEKIECQAYSGYYELMIQELDRANNIITEYLSLAKNRPIRLEYQDLNQIIHALSPLIEANALVYNQTLEIQTSEVSPLYVDEKEIRQLILNLVRNAIEAMKDGGRLLIKTSQQEEEVILSVQDNGPGIEPTVLEKLGTPFISTKTNGTGLGLAVCYSIALRHQAVIHVDSDPAGTTFRVRFKASQEIPKEEN